MIGAVIGVWGCTDEPADDGPTSASNAAPSFEGTGEVPEWTGPPDSPVVATVGSRPIRLADLERQMQFHPNAQPREVLQAMIEGEALAQDAVRQNLHRSRPVVGAWRQSLAREFLDQVFEREVTPRSMPMDYVQRVYKNKRVRFKHKDRYKSAHMWFTCCHSGKPEECGDAETIECFSIKHELIQDLYRQAKDALTDVSGDAKGMSVAMQAFAESARQQFPGLSFEVWRFFWDRTMTRKEQAGHYELADEAFAKVIIDLPLSTLSEPFKTEYGWHIATKLDFNAAEQRSVMEPDVIAEIRSSNFQFYQRVAFTRLVESFAMRLNKAGKFVVQPDGLSVLDNYWGTKE